MRNLFGSYFAVQLIFKCAIVESAASFMAVSVESGDDVEPPILHNTWTNPVNKLITMDCKSVQFGLFLYKMNSCMQNFTIVTSLNLLLVSPEKLGNTVVTKICLLMLIHRVELDLKLMNTDRYFTDVFYHQYSSKFGTLLS